MADMTGHNSNELTPAEAKALYMHHFRSILAQQENVDREIKERKRLRGLAKADGLVLADIDFGIRCATIDDPNIIVQEQLRHIEIAEFFAMPIGAQPGFDFAREPGIDRAAREGQAAGFAMKDRQSPYATDSAQGQAWLTNYDKGKAEGLAAYQRAMEKRAAGKAASDEPEGTEPPYDNDDEQEEKQDTAAE